MLKIDLNALKDKGPITAAWEILFVVACVLASEWLSPLIFGKNWYAGAVPAVIALGFIILSQVAKREGLSEQGWRVDNLSKAILLLLPPMLVSAAVLLAIGWYFGSLQISALTPDFSVLAAAIGLLIWGLTQQYPLQAFINRRSQAIWGPGLISVVFVAGVFALLHFPNVPLMIATFFGGLMWAFVYQRAPNLWALALSHALMTAVLGLTVPNEALHGLRVGYNYFF